MPKANLPLTSWSLEDFMKAFTPTILHRIDNINFCGIWGDPMLNPEILNIITYIIESSDTTIDINTNGSMQNDGWWWNLGILCDDRLTVTFDVDGTNQQMHSAYRINTRLNKILSNMETLSMTKANVRSCTIVFKHNQDYLDDIKRLCFDYGSERHSHIISTRFYKKNNKFVTMTYGLNDNIIYDHATLDQKDYSVIRGPDKKVIEKVECSWSKDNTIEITPDGQVYQCCYMATRDYESKNNIMMHDLSHSSFIEYIPTDNNVLTKSLIDILDGDYLSKILPGDIEQNPCDVCIKHCSSMNGVDAVGIKLVEII